MMQTEDGKLTREDIKELERNIKNLESEVVKNPSDFNIKELRRLRRMRIE